MSQQRIYEIDGKKFSSLEEFYTHFAQVMMDSNREMFGNNLDALNDVLNGGFGTPEELMIIWRNSNLSKQILQDKFDNILGIIHEHKNIELKLE